MAVSSHAPTTRRSQPKTNRVAILSGLRTPFAKQGTAYKQVSALELGATVVTELLARMSVDPSEFQQLVFGSVLPSLEAPNIAREIVLMSPLPKSVDAFSVSRACATSFQSVVSVAQAIELGTITGGLAGGADSASVVPITISKKLAAALVDLSKAKTLTNRISILSTLSVRDLVPIPPSAKEFSTQKTMGEHAEEMAKDHQISREEQDRFAHSSHCKASAAWREGRLEQQVMHTYFPPFREVLAKDNNIRDDSALESYTRLKPAFDKKYGTITPGTSSPLTDGAAAVALMREDRAKSLGLKPLGYLRSAAFAALDPRRDMLMGPSYATPLALDRAGLTLKNMSLVDMHEAFAAQVLCNVKAFASAQFAKEKLGRAAAIGEIDMDRFNVVGGSIAYGHPFAATGARMITQTLWELKRCGGEFALVTACAAGGLGAAVVLEVA